MSDDRSRRGSSPAESERLDDVIDDIGRQMTEGAAPNDLRARVLARLTTIPESRSANPSRALRLWTLAPIAGAALIIVAVLVVRDRGPRFDRLPRTPARQESASPIARAQQTKPLEPSVQAAPGAVARGNHRPTKAGRASARPSVSEV